jgi:hypothetical protein
MICFYKVIAHNKKNRSDQIAKLTPKAIYYSKECVIIDDLHMYSVSHAFFFLTLSKNKLKELEIFVSE